MIRGFRAIGRAVTATALSAGLVVAAAPGANALTMPAGDTSEVISTTETNPVPDGSADVPVDGLLGTLTGTLTGTIGGLLGTLTDTATGLVGTILSALLPGSGTPSTGDGTWSPSHDEATAIIPVCSGPSATLDWLFVNFSDHGDDLGTFLTTNSDHIIAVVTGSADPYQTLQYLLTPFLQVPVYAINDTVFHQEATLGDILAFCESARA